jgi:glycosyltransferase involved in cell wall biosynthesis
MEAAGLGPVSVFCHRFDAVTLSQTAGWNERTRITAVGAVHELGSPNHDGLIWFMNSIYPKCASVFSDMKLTVVGYWRADILQNFRQRYPDANIDFVGAVSDDELRVIYDESRMALAPTRFAAGVASKVLEAMSLGVPVVMTDLLERQLAGAALAGQTALATASRNDDGLTFAQWVTVLASDEGRWCALRERQLELVKPLGGAEAFEGGLDTLLQRAGIKYQTRR